MKLMLDKALPEPTNAFATFELAELLSFDPAGIREMLVMPGTFAADKAFKMLADIGGAAAKREIMSIVIEQNLTGVSHGDANN
ncbi:MAG: hypothetical protein GY811_06425 [Myxococcales bacterium]|nr:hypothetical protein [Myxococcales bacterium]